MVRRHVIGICLRSRLLRDGISLILKEAHYRIQISKSDVNELKSAKLKTDSKIILLVECTSDLTSVIEFKELYPQGLIVLLLDSCSDEQRRHIERLGVAGV